LDREHGRTVIGEEVAGFIIPDFHALIFAGGGAIELNADGNLTINADIRVNGGESPNGDRNGGTGSGGSLKLIGNIVTLDNAELEAGAAMYGCLTDASTGAVARAAVAASSLATAKATP